MENKKIDTEKKKETLGETFRTVFYAVIIAVLVRTFWFEPFKIPSGSMYPTLEVGDFLFVSKYTYGYSRHSFPFSFPSFKGRIWQDLPERGDVVVFKYPGDNKTDYIKRIIGIPGDTVQVKDGLLYINHQNVPRQKVGRYVISEYTPFPQEFVEYIETLPNGKQHRILEYSDDVMIVDNTPEFTVPEGHYFMMGDNRDNSNDSRKDIGMVPLENIEGKARFLFYSHDDTSSWYNPISWIMAIRWKRLFNKIN
ncbi:MAG: signal peptidase I [Alphaproteobacteria bacterium]|nr:signal peptidase I [Alphaproteobacteria bacterium]